MTMLRAFVLPLPAMLAVAGADAAERCGPGLRMVYAESAPRDYVFIENLSPEGWRIARIVWHLEASQGALIFDTVTGGAGIDSAHPFIALESPVRLADLPLIGDGETSMAIDFDEFGPGAEFRFSIDLDDTALGLPDTIVDGGEIEGAEVEAIFVNEAGLSLGLLGSFGADATVEVETPCTS